MQTKTVRWYTSVSRCGSFCQIGITWSKSNGLALVKDGQLVQHDESGTPVTISGQIAYKRYMNLGGFYSLIYSPTWLQVFEIRIWRRRLNTTDFITTAYEKGKLCCF